MPGFWQFPTVSMGLGPLMAIYQARFMKYLAGPRDRRHRRTARSGRSWATARWTSRSRWARSRSPGASTSTTSIFVINCNLQRLDGPVRGNGKIIQELETNFRGAGWNVIKVIWGGRWDPLLAADTRGPARRAHGGGASTASTRSTSRATARSCASTSSAPTPSCCGWSSTCPTPRSGRSNRGGHDPQKVYAAYPRRSRHTRPADGDPRQDDQGLRDGRVRRGPEHHPPAEEDGRGRAAAPSATASTSTSPTRRSATSPSTSRPTTRPRWCTCASGARRSAAACRSGVADAAAARRCPSCRRSRPSSRAPASARSPPRWRSCGSCRRCCATRASAAHRADRPRRVAHVRHGGAVPPARHLQPGRPALHARGRRAADVLPRGQARPDPPGGDQRAGRDVARGSPRRPRTPTTAWRWCRSTSTTRCSASSASATSRGPRATAARAASWSAAPRGARRSTARACSTRTATATSRRR